MDTSYSYQDSLHLLNDSEWNKLSLQNKASVLQSVENEVARREGRPPCNVSLFSEAPKNGSYTAGQYNPANGNTELNTHHLSGKASDCLTTILHEGRHSYQEKAVSGKVYHHNQAELKAWRHNMKPGNYIEAEKNIRAYYRQPIEADSREYADITSRQILTEQKIQNNSTNKGIEAARQKAAANQSGKSSSQSTNKRIENYRNMVSGQSIGNSNSGGSQSTGRGQER